MTSAFFFFLKKNGSFCVLALQQYGKFDPFLYMCIKGVKMHSTTCNKFFFKIKKGITITNK